MDSMHILFQRLFREFLLPSALAAADVAEPTGNVERRVGEDEVEAAGGVVRGWAMSNDELRVANLVKSERRIADFE